MTRIKLDIPIKKPEIKPFFPAIFIGFSSFSLNNLNNYSSLAKDETVLILVNESLLIKFL